MFKELLISNGYEIKVVNTGVSSVAEQVMSIQIRLNGVGISEYLVVAYYQDVKDNQLEQACMQYCIENGVKLEWLENKINALSKIDGTFVQKYVKHKHLTNDFDYFICGYKVNSHNHKHHNVEIMVKNGLITKPTFTSFYNSDEWAGTIGEITDETIKFDKLIAAIYAHDIKII